MKPCDDSRRALSKPHFDPVAKHPRTVLQRWSLDRQVYPPPIKKEARVRTSLLRRDVAGYAYIYQPEASPIARRARYNHLTLAAPKSCAQIDGPPGGKGSSKLLPLRPP